MVETAPHAIEIEFRAVKRAARAIMLAALSIPLIYFGPLLWKEGTYTGRWEFVTDMDVQPTDCIGISYVLQFCEVKFTDRLSDRTSKIQYLASGGNFNNMPQDIVRSTSGNLSSSHSTTQRAILERFGVLVVLLLMFYLLEWAYLWLRWRIISNRPDFMPPAPEQSKETVILSRDRRDRF